MRQLTPIFRWTARVLSLAVFALVLMFMIGEASAEPAVWPTGGEWLGVLFFPVGLVVGLLLGWHRERWGGWLAIVSTAAFYLWDYARSGDFPRGPWLFILTVPAVFYLLAAFYDGQKSPDKARMAMG